MVKYRHGEYSGYPMIFNWEAVMKAALKITQIVEVILDKENKREVTFVFSGTSGTTAVCALRMVMPTYIKVNLVQVQKKEEASARGSVTVMGNYNQYPTPDYSKGVVFFVDDLVCTGRTLTHVEGVLSRDYPKVKLNGVILFNNASRIVQDRYQYVISF